MKGDLEKVAEILLEKRIDEYKINRIQEHLNSINDLQQKIKFHRDTIEQIKQHNVIIFEDGFTKQNA